MKNKFFDKIDFNKSWDENDWEEYFQAQDAYRISNQLEKIRKIPASRVKFEGKDEVEAFDPIFRAYGIDDVPSVVNQVRSRPFLGDSNPEADYHPTTEEDLHYWREGAPLANSLIYRDSCRFAICTSQEIDRYIKSRGPVYKRKHNAEFESLRFHANWAAINVGHGHKIGYSNDRIYGNIAKCRRALTHVEICIGLISRISLKTQSYALRHELFSFAVQLRNALFSWIDELRLRCDSDEVEKE